MRQGGISRARETIENICIRNWVITQPGKHLPGEMSRFNGLVSQSIYTWFSVICKKKYITKMYLNFIDFLQNFDVLGEIFRFYGFIFQSIYRSVLCDV